MSDNFNSNDYGEYFKYLEKRLEKNAGDNGGHSSEVAARNKSQKNRRYKVIKIRPAAFVCVFAAVILLTAGAIGISASKGKDKGKKDTPDSILSDTPKTDNAEIAVPAISYRFTDGTQEIPSSNDAGGAIIINSDTHEVIASRNPNKRFYPASTTKIMTLLVAVENITDYSDTFTMTLDITDPLFKAEASVAGFLNGEEITMTDLLYGTILPSGADAAIGLAVKIAGSEKAFAELMNEKARQLGLENTHFVNVTGLFDENHYTTPYDMAVILETALNYPICKKILSTYQYTTKPTAQHPDGIPMSATLFDYMYGTEPETATVLGGKTGFVNESGYCIASYGSNNTTGNKYIIVTLKNSSRWPAIHGLIDLYKQFAE